MRPRIIDGRYVVVRKLGAGSTGTVYQVHLAGDKKPLALKILHPDLSGLSSPQSLRDEFLLLAQFDHPNILKINNFGLTSKNQPYFLMEFVQGPSFDRSLLQVISLKDLCSILVDICLALDYIHAHGFVHKDVKPANILLQSRPQRALLAKLSDFGLAAPRAGAGGIRLSGTLEYFAPEMIRGGAMDRRADLYSLGVTLYEVLTGQNPFRAQEPHQVLRNHLEKAVESPRQYNKQIPEFLEKVVLRLMEKDPLDRFPTARAVIDHLCRDAGYNLTDQQERAGAILPPGQFVGRRSEMARLRKWHDQVLEGKATLVFVTGEYGLGKTRLLKEFAISCQLQGTTVIGDAIGGRGVEQLRSLAAGLDSADGARALKPEEEGMSLSAQASAETAAVEYQVWELVCRQFGQFSRPLLLLMKDLESSDPAIWSFIQYLLGRLPRHPLMICATYQPSLLDAERRSLLRSIKKGQQGAPVHSLQLRPLTRAALAQLIRSRFKLMDGEKKLLEFLHAQSRGNPLYVEEFVAAMRAQKVLMPCPGGWSFDENRLSQLRFPRALADIAEVTMAGMTPAVRELLSASAVLGDEFQLDDLRAMLPFSEKKFYATLGEALKAGFLSRKTAVGGRGHIYFFSKTGLRDGLYKSLDADTRKDIHRKIALRIEKKPPEEKNLMALADHFHRAEEYAKSSRYSLRAAGELGVSSRVEESYRLLQQSLEAKEAIGETSQLVNLLEALGDNCLLQGSYQEGQRHFDRALDLLTKRAGKHFLELQRKRAVILWKQGQFDSALGILDGALDQSDDPNLRLPRARILAEIGWVKRMKSDYDGALAALNESLKLLRWGRDRADTAQVLNRLGIVSWTLGRYQEAQCYYERALKMYQELGDRGRIAALLDNLGLAHLSQGHLERAIANFQECHHLRKTAADVLGEAKASHNLAMAYAENGDWDQAIAFYMQSQRIKARIGDLDGLARTLNNLGILHMHRGIWDEAERCQREALRLRKKMDDKHGLCLSYDNLGDLAKAKGDWKPALQYYEKARRLRAEIKDEVGSCFSLLHLGRLEMEQGRDSKAQKGLLSSKACLQQFSDPVGLMQVDLALAELYLSQGQVDRARELAEQSLPQASETGNVFLKAQVARTMAVIEALSGEQAAASELFGQSIEMLKRLQARYELAKTYFLLAVTRQASRRVSEAVRYYRESLLIFEKLGVKHFMSRIEKQLKNLETTLERQESAELFTLYTMSEILNSMRDLNLLLEKVLDLAIEMLHAERGAIIFYDRQEDDFQIQTARSMEKQTLSDALEISRSVVKDVTQKGKPVVVDNAMQDEKFSGWQSVAMYNIMSILCVPLKMKEKIIGTIYLDNRNVPGIFSAKDVTFLESFSNLTALAIENAKMYSELHGENVYLKRELHAKYRYDNIVGNSKVMQDIFNIITRVSPSRASVLILGDSGTGKELVARLIHYSSPRSDKPFLQVNCAALTESLLESELFGIEERVATGVKSRKGKFELAHGGTIFLDEIGDMSLTTQAKVLRVLQEQEFDRVGGSKTIKVDVRVLSATNQNLQEAIVAKTFRKDLFYRLNTVTVNIPPLRDRKEDIPYLVDYFVKKYCQENEKKPIVVSAEVMETFMKYDWPGNVRQLSNIVERGVVMAEGKSFPIWVIPSVAEDEEKELTFSVTASKTKLNDIVDSIEREVIERALREHQYVQVKAAKVLGLSESALRYKMHKYGMKG